MPFNINLIHNSVDFTEFRHPLVNKQFVHFYETLIFHQKCRHARTAFILFFYFYEQGHRDTGKRNFGTLINILKGSASLVEDSHNFDRENRKKHGF